MSLPSSSLVILSFTFPVFEPTDAGGCDHVSGDPIVVVAISKSKLKEIYCTNTKIMPLVIHLFIKQSKVLTVLCSLSNLKVGRSH